jgi:hypothetical protein
VLCDNAAAAADDDDDDVMMMMMMMMLEAVCLRLSNFPSQVRLEHHFTRTARVITADSLSRGERD